MVPLWLFKTEYNEQVNGKTVVHGHFEKVGSISETLQQKLRDNDIPEDLLQSFLRKEAKSALYPFTFLPFFFMVSRISDACFPNENPA